MAAINIPVELLLDKLFVAKLITVLSHKLELNRTLQVLSKVTRGYLNYENEVMGIEVLKVLTS